MQLVLHRSASAEQQWITSDWVQLVLTKSAIGPKAHNVTLSQNTIYAVLFWDIIYINYWHFINIIRSVFEIIHFIFLCIYDGLIILDLDVHITGHWHMVDNEYEIWTQYVQLFTPQRHTSTNTDTHQEPYLPGYNIMQSSQVSWHFSSNIRVKNKQSRKPAWSRQQAGLCISVVCTDF
jgi:hypothetical protein